MKNLTKTNTLNKRSLFNWRTKKKRLNLASFLNNNPNRWEANFGNEINLTPWKVHWKKTLIHLLTQKVYDKCKQFNEHQFYN